MSDVTSVQRELQDAVVALVRLDEGVRAMGVHPALPLLLTLRSAQAIVAGEGRPSGGVATATEREAAVLIAEGFAPAARLWFADGTPTRVHDGLSAADTARRLDELRLAVRGGEPLASALHSALPANLRAVLRDAERERWPSVLCAGALSADACAEEAGVTAAMARAVSLVDSAVLEGAYVVAPTAPSLAGALTGIAREAGAMRRRVEAYRASSLAAASRCAAFGRGGATAHAVVEFLQARPACMVADVVETLRVSTPTAGAAIERLSAAGIAREITGRGRDRVFVYEPAVALIG